VSFEWEEIDNKKFPVLTVDKESAHDLIISR
jgi:hypothetical protein